MFSDAAHRKNVILNEPLVSFSQFLIRSCFASFKHHLVDYLNIGFSELMYRYVCFWFDSSQMRLLHTQEMFISDMFCKYTGVTLGQGFADISICILMGVPLMYML